MQTVIAFRIRSEKEMPTVKKTNSNDGVVIEQGCIKCKDSWILSELTCIQFATSFKPFVSRKCHHDKPFAPHKVIMGNSQIQVSSWWTICNPIMGPKKVAVILTRHLSCPQRWFCLPIKGRQEIKKMGSLVRFWSLIIHSNWCTLYFSCPIWRSPSSHVQLQS